MSVSDLQTVVAHSLGFLAGPESSISPVSSLEPLKTEKFAVDGCMDFCCLLLLQSRANESATKSMGKQAKHSISQWISWKGRP